MAKYEKSRYWAMIYYEDSLIKDYAAFFQDNGIRAVVSPWHDQDFNEDTGERKKKHKHIILCWDGPATQGQAEKITKQFGSPIPIAQVSIKGAVAYLTHSNNPEKYQYDRKDIEVYGFDSVEEVIDLLEEDIRNLYVNIYKKMTEGIIEYSDMCEYYMKNGYLWEFKYVREHTITIKAIIDSYRLKNKNKIEYEYIKGYKEK